MRSIIVKYEDLMTFKFNEFSRTTVKAFLLESFDIIYYSLIKEQSNLQYIHSGNPTLKWIFYSQISYFYIFIEIVIGITSTKLEILKTTNYNKIILILIFFLEF